MKPQKILILFALFIGMTSCKKDEVPAVDNGITFRQYNQDSGKDKTSFSFVEYEEIIGYDSVNCVFQLNDLAWERLANEVEPVVPDSHFGFFVALNNQFIYAAAYVQPYSSFARRDIITFRIKEPCYILIELGYPAVPKSEFTGKDLRNDQQIIERLKKDNKLIEIED